MIRISKQVIKSHFRYVFSSYDDFLEEAPEAPSGYLKDIENMRRIASFFGDLNTLNLAIGYLLVHPEVDVLDFVESLNGYEDEEVRAILNYAWEIIPQDTKEHLQSSISQVELVDMSLEEWERFKENKIGDSFIL